MGFDVPYELGPGLEKFKDMGLLAKRGRGGENWSVVGGCMRLSFWGVEILVRKIHRGEVSCQVVAVHINRGFCN